MPRKPYNDQTARYNVIVPLEDSQVCEWIEHQRNVSMSVRFAIKKIVELFGMCNITCLPTGDIHSLLSLKDDSKNDEQVIEDEKVEVPKADVEASEVKSEQENDTGAPEIKSEQEDEMDKKGEAMFSSLLDLA